MILYSLQRLQLAEGPADHFKISFYHGEMLKSEHARVFLRPDLINEGAGGVWAEQPSPPSPDGICSFGKVEYSALSLFIKAEPPFLTFWVVMASVRLSPLLGPKNTSEKKNPVPSLEPVKMCDFA